MTRRLPLERRTVRWRYAGEDVVRVTTYLAARHHEDKPEAASRNAADRASIEAYDQACQEGKAVIVSTTTEADDGS